MNDDLKCLYAAAAHLRALVLSWLASHGWPWDQRLSRLVDSLDVFLQIQEAGNGTGSDD
jgi:hypothetical protein